MALVNQITFKSGFSIEYDNNANETVFQDPNGNELARFASDGVAYPQGFSEIKPKVVDGHIHYVSQYDSLDAALSASSKHDTIVLEDTTYGGGGTIPERRNVVGVGVGAPESILEGNWTIEERCMISRVSVGTNSNITISGNLTWWTDSFIGYGRAITVDAKHCILYGLQNGDVEFASGTIGNIVDASSRVNVTDNGNNTVGDIA